MNKAFAIPWLTSGGLITNYHCTSKCRHCLYNCSPSRSKDYIDSNLAQNLFKIAKEYGARSMHIGGGEPFIAREKLVTVLDAARITGMQIEYVETNSSWYKNQDQACRLLEELKTKGLATLLVSVSPFHMEYIPFSKTIGVIKACRETGVHPFLWRENFISDLAKFNPDRPHRLEKVFDKMGPDYLSTIKRRYWIHPGGRALEAFRPLYPQKTVSQIIAEAGADCRTDLSDTSHFHLDLLGYYIPGLCAGLGIRCTDLEKPLDSDRYPIISLLAKKGVAGLVEFAEKHHGFSEDKKGYTNKCDLCNAIRHFLVRENAGYEELSPFGYYREG